MCYWNLFATAYQACQAHISTCFNSCVEHVVVNYLCMPVSIVCHSLLLNYQLFCFNILLKKKISVNSCKNKEKFYQNSKSFSRNIYYWFFEVFCLYFTNLIFVTSKYFSNSVPFIFLKLLTMSIVLWNRRMYSRRKS